ncbi:MAG: preprotein translocase subunit SecE [Planctomycetaceae bacterium]|nr:preprotein translocase subunit SecE [Planctomycetaceae bacterium]
MAKAKEASLASELFSASLYKRNQGRLTRQLTAASVILVFGFGALTLGKGALGDSEAAVKYGVPTMVAAVGVWLAFRAVNLSKFADFLISVEAEMDKVSWSSWDELRRSTIVVIVTMFSLGALLFLYDVFWQFFFSLPFINFLQV